jgi:predicted DNA-binding transcriptional regulator YafY
VKHWVLGWGKHAEILEPEFLREEVTRELKASLERYEAAVRERRRG